MGDGDDEFWRRVEAYGNESTDDFIKRYSRTHDELRETIAYLIRHREMIKDLELKKLHAEAKQLISRLKNIDREQLIEELRCFKDILALQRRLIHDATDSEQSKNGGA